MSFGGGEHPGFADELIATFETFRAFASSHELLNAGPCLCYKGKLIDFCRHTLANSALPHSFIAVPQTFLDRLDFRYTFPRVL